MSWVGVDGCRSGWLFIELHEDGFQYGVVPSLDVLIAELPDEANVFLDIPIGLLEGGKDGRECDAAARRVLGPRRSSIFPAPLRPVLASEDYDDAKQRSIAASGKAISKQTYAIVPKIREVDELLQGNEKAKRLVREVHPEVCFWALAGGRPMSHHKKKEPGFRERMAVLEASYRGATKVVAQAYLWTSGQGVARDDVVDAMVNAVTAKAGAAAHRTLPENPPRDSVGLPMEMVYAVL